MIEMDFVFFDLFLTLIRPEYPFGKKECGVSMRLFQTLQTWQS
jgi:hypothetical protein